MWQQTILLWLKSVCLVSIDNSGLTTFNLETHSLHQLYIYILIALKAIQNKIQKRTDLPVLNEMINLQKKISKSVDGHSWSRKSSISLLVFVTHKMYKDSTWIHNKHTSSNFLSANRASVLICDFYHVPSGFFKLLLDLQTRRTHSHLDKHSREDKRLFAWKCLCKILPADSHFDEDSWSQTNYVVSLKIWAPMVEEMEKI